MDTVESVRAKVTRLKECEAEIIRLRVEFMEIHRALGTHASVSEPEAQPTPSNPPDESSSGGGR